MSIAYECVGRSTLQFSTEVTQIAKIWNRDDLVQQNQLKHGSRSLHKHRTNLAPATTADEKWSAGRSRGKVAAACDHMEAYWSDPLDQSAGFQALIGATLWFVNTGPDDAHDVRVSAYAAGVASFQPPWLTSK